MDELHFEGDPAIHSTRRRLERILKNEPRSGWGWLAAFAAGSSALIFWQVRKRRKNNPRPNSAKELTREGSNLREGSRAHGPSRLIL